MNSSFELVSCFPLIPKPDNDTLEMYQVYIQFSSVVKFLIKYHDDITCHNVIKEFRAEELTFSIAFKPNSLVKSIFLSIYSYDFKSCIVIVQNENSLIREDLNNISHNCFSWLEIDLNRLY
jgi:hypothetical protein